VTEGDIVTKIAGMRDFPVWILVLFGLAAVFFLIVELRSRRWKQDARQIAGLIRRYRPFGWPSGDAKGYARDLLARSAMRTSDMANLIKLAPSVAMGEIAEMKEVWDASLAQSSRLKDAAQLKDRFFIAEHMLYYAWIEEAQHDAALNAEFWINLIMIAIASGQHGNGPIVEAIHLIGDAWSQCQAAEGAAPSPQSPP